jgi:hypothetical protein
MKEFTALYQRLDPHPGSAVSEVAETEAKEETKLQEGGDEEKAPRPEEEDDGAIHSDTHALCRRGQLVFHGQSGGVSFLVVFIHFIEEEASQGQVRRGMCHLPSGRSSIGASAVRSVRLRDRVSLRLLCSPALSRTRGQLVLRGVQADSEAGPG